ncbi:MAG: hypothetical protein ACR2RB_08105 [Gammaproteobacteria bacterium]
MEACRGLGITADDFLGELYEAGDLRDVQFGVLSARGLRLVAESLDLRNRSSKL